MSCRGRQALPAAGRRSFCAPHTIVHCGSRSFKGCKRSAAGLTSAKTLSGPRAVARIWLWAWSRSIRASSSSWIACFCAEKAASPQGGWTSSSATLADWRLQIFRVRAPCRWTGDFEWHRTGAVVSLGEHCGLEAAEGLQVARLCGCAPVSDSERSGDEEDFAVRAAFRTACARPRRECHRSRQPGA